MAAKISPNISPKIALNFDRNHYDIAERVIHSRLRAIDPWKQILHVQESSFFEIESLNQYSLELLSQDEPLSTSTACTLLSQSICWRVDPSRLTQILFIIYFDPAMKELFMEKSYFKFNPCEHGLNFQCDKLDENNVTTSQRNTIKTIEELFKLLGRTLPNLEVDQQVEYLIKNLPTDLVLEKGDYPFFAKIWEAIAFMKIKQVLEKLGPNSDKSKELSLDMINRLHQGPSCEKNFFLELNANFRTRFQAQKVIKLVEKILSAKNADPNTIFLVRDGISHREFLIPLLTQHFKRGEIKEIVLTTDDVSGMEEKIREKFAAAPNLLPQPSNVVVGTRTGTYETTHPLLQELPVFQFSE